MSREPWATHPSRGTDPRAVSRGICYGPEMRALGPSTMSNGKEIGSLEPCPEPRGVSREPRIKSPEPRAVSREPRDLKMILSVCINNTSHKKDIMLVRKFSLDRKKNGVGGQERRTRSQGPR